MTVADLLRTYNHRLTPAQLKAQRQRLRRAGISAKSARRRLFDLDRRACAASMAAMVGDGSHLVASRLLSQLADLTGDATARKTAAAHRRLARKAA